MQVYIGIDWSKNKHDVCFLNQQGAILTSFTIPDTPIGFAAFAEHRAKLGVAPEDCLLGIETHRLLFMDYLLSHHYSSVYVIPPSISSDSRGRFGPSRANTDQSDAHLLADMVRTDRARLHPWQPDSPLTQEIAARVSLERCLTRSIIQFTNRLRQTLWRYYPNASEVFSSLDTLIALDFICAYPTPSAAAHLSFEEFQHFAKAHRYPNPKKLPACFSRLQDLQPEPSQAVLQAYAGEAIRLAELLKHMIQAHTETQKEIQALFRQHPDAPIFDSLPGAGEKLAPALLSSFGDNRQRYPTPEALQAVAGTCPVTRQSGKKKNVHFRRACDHEFRTIVQQWARCSLDYSVWANTYFHQVWPHCRSTSHAYRCLGNRWLAIAWKLWQDRVPYDEAYHLRQHALRVKPK